MKTSTIPVQAPKWLIVDAEGQNLGRLSAKIAHILRGKHRASFSPHQPCGDQVVVINASKLLFHPTKLRRKTYFKHTGYLGHTSTTSLEKMFEKNPTSVIERAVKGMLAANRLRPIFMKRLHVYAGAEHEHAAQKPEILSLTK